MGQRTQHRNHNGMFRRSSLADYGLAVLVCIHCKGLNPYQPATEQKPETCCQCGKPLSDARRASDANVFRELCEENPQGLDHLLSDLGVAPQTADELSMATMDPERWDGLS